MGDVLAFPLHRRVDLVRRQAAWFVSQDGHRAAEANLFAQLQRQRDALLSKGVDPVGVESHVRALEGAIRAEAWRVVLGGDGSGAMA